MPNQLRRDPSRTSMLRNSFGKEMRKRFRAVADAVRELVIDDDAFGLIPKKGNLVLMQQVPTQAWRFQSNASKVKSFRAWLQQQIDAQILTVDTTGKPWTAQYVTSAYMKGANRAYVDIHRPDLTSTIGLFRGGMEEFLRTSFSAQTAMSEVEALYTRSFTELKGITDAMSQQMSRILTNGLVHGKGAAFIAGELRRNIANITKTRAMVLARTEIVAAQAEGQLTAFELLGVKKVGIFAEWLTAGDDKVCPLCFELEGVIMTIDQARGLIPRHPNCRCAWAPASKFQKQKGQIWSPRQRKAAMARSIQAERPNVPFAEAKRKSVWGGKDIRGVGGRAGERAAKVISPETIRQQEITELLNQLKVTEEVANINFLKYPSSYEKEGTSFIKAHEQKKALLKRYLDKVAPNWSKKGLTSIERDKARSAFSQALQNISSNHSKFNGLKVVDNGITKKSVGIKRMGQRLDSFSNKSVGSRFANLHYSEYEVVRLRGIQGKYGVDKARAYARVNEGRIFLNRSESASTTYHEFGHLFEKNTPLRVKLSRWRTWRNKDAGSASMNKLSKYGSYDADEFAMIDRFIDPYTGKIYRDGGTEVFSMGLQQFASDSSLMSFAKKDFDHFSLIVESLNGLI